MRMQPCEARVPIDQSWPVPWMPTPFAMPIQRAFSGLAAVPPCTVVLVMAAQGGGRILPFAPVSAGLRLAMLSYGFVEVTGKSVDIAQITAFTFGVGAVLSISGLIVAAVILAREFGTLSPRGAVAAARERIPGAPWRRSLPESAT